MFKLMLKLYSILKIAVRLTPLLNKKSHLGHKIQSFYNFVNLKATDTDVCRYNIILIKV